MKKKKDDLPMKSDIGFIAHTPENYSAGCSEMKNNIYKGLHNKYFFFTFGNI